MNHPVDPTAATDTPSWMDQTVKDTPSWMNQPADPLVPKNQALIGNAPNLILTTDDAEILFEDYYTNKVDIKRAAHLAVFSRDDR